VDFRILGPLEVLDDGRALDLGGGKQRAVLAVLLLRANRVVSRDDLVDAIWGERAPETATKALQVYVSQLRKALGRDRILTRAPGYELRVEPGELDLQQFTQLVESRRFAEALRLRRGAPLADFAYEPFAQSEIARLDELGLACLEQRIDADLEAGRHAALVAELEALVGEHPLRERLRAQLMLALYRSGRQAEALDAYQAGRTLLSDELGLEPGADLKELQRAILEQDPRLASPPPSPPEPLSRRAEASGASTMSPPASAREVRKTVTVLFCDVTAVGSQLDPESLRNLTARGFDELLPVLERHGATVERSLGGAAAAIFGIPVVHEDDALRAVLAATEMRERLAAVHQELEDHWGAWLVLRIGIGTGEVVAGGEPYAIGEPVQSALGLQREARPDELLVDERTHQLIRDAVDVETSDERIRVAGLRAIPAGHGPIRGFDSPMVGRDRERQRLDDAFEQAVIDRSCQLFTILGAAGMGKSRLVQEFVSGVAADALVARGRCLPYGEGITYWPVLEAVRDATRLDDAASSEDNLRQLAALLDSEEDEAVAARRLGEVLGLLEQTSRR
jgi:DNA-binding SARP family transcriptional activator